MIPIAWPQKSDLVALAVSVLSTVAVSWFFYRLSLRHAARRGARRPPRSRRARLVRVLTFALLMVAVASGGFWLGTRGLGGSATPVAGPPASPSDSPGETSSPSDASSDSDTPAGDASPGSSTTPAGSAAVPASAEVDESVAVVVNGYALSEKGFVQDGVAMVPMEAVFGALGADVLHDQTGGTVTAIRRTATAVVTIGSTEAYAHDWRFTLDAPAVSIGGVTYVPLRFCLTGLDAQVSYDTESRRAEIGSPGPTSPAEELHLTGYQPVIDRGDFEEAVAHAAEYRDQEPLTAPYTRTIDDGDCSVYANIITPWGSAASSAWWMMRHGLAMDEDYIARELEIDDGRLVFDFWIAQGLEFVNDAEYSAVVYQNRVAYRPQCVGRGPFRRTGYPDSWWVVFTFLTEGGQLDPTGLVILEVTGAGGGPWIFEWNLAALR